MTSRNGPSTSSGSSADPSSSPAIASSRSSTTRCAAYPDVAELDERDHEWFDDDPPLLLPFRVDVGGTALSFFTTLTAFATPLDVTLEELAIELFFPADAETDARLTAGGLG